MLILHEGGMTMRTVKEVSKLSGVSIRTLQYYDKIGLLHPTGHTQSGYRLYDDTALEKLQQILLFRELEFSLKEIKEILSDPNYDRGRALEQQIELLTMKKEHLENLILFARGIQMLGVKTMDFSVFDTKKIDEYAKRAKEQWGKTPQYKEFEQKTKNRTKQETQSVMEAFAQIFAELGTMQEQAADSADVQKQIKKLHDYINEHFYTCSKDILFSLGQMYAGGGEFTKNIDAMSKEGTAEFAAEAIRIYCGK